MNAPRLPDLPVAANQRHRMMVSIVRGSWIAWCNCGDVQECSSFEEGYQIRSEHHERNSIFRGGVTEPV